MIERIYPVAIHSEIVAFDMPSQAGGYIEDRQSPGADTLMPLQPGYFDLPRQPDADTPMPLQMEGALIRYLLPA